MKKLLGFFFIITLIFTLVSCGECKHEWTDADCTSPKICAVCGEADGEALGHSLKKTVTPPTCLDKGFTYSLCEVCGFSETTDYTEAHGHTYGDWVIVTPVTSKNSDGFKRASCVNCDTQKTAFLEITAEGNLGSNVAYTLFEDGTLLLSGSGSTLDCAWNGASQPYANLRDKVTRAIVGEGITELRGGVFAYMPNLVEYEFPSSLKKLSGNTFMDSFSNEVTSFTFPKSINYLGICTIGQFRESNALFTDVYVENPDITLSVSDSYIPFNSYAGSCRNLTLYSHGTDNNVRKFADTYGIRYVDLDSTVIGSIGSLAYELFDGTLKLSAVDGAINVSVPENFINVANVNTNEVKVLSIEDGITYISNRAFYDCDKLTQIILPDSLKSVGQEAFAVSSPCNTSVSLSFGNEISSISSDFLKNRSGVSLNGFKSTVLDGFVQSGVKVNLQNSLKILLIGNSLSLDAADYLNASRPSQLYSIIKAMTGDTAFVEIAVLYSGAKSAGWHATVAEIESPAYQFFVISDKSGGKWVEYGNYTTKQALLFDSWDIVTIQPYASEALSGVGSTNDTDTNPEKTAPVKAEKFYSLDSSLPYLLDYINQYRENAKVYYYLTWSNSVSPIYNHNAGEYEERLAVAIQALTLKGETSGKGFDGLIPVGTAIQNARTTALGLIYYNDPSGNENFTQKGLQRDGVHLSIETGRYVAGLSFAEILVPSDYRLSSYILPHLSTSETIGSQRELTEAAQISVQKMLESCNAEADGRYKPCEISK